MLLICWRNWEHMLILCWRINIVSYDVIPFHIIECRHWYKMTMQMKLDSGLRVKLYFLKFNALTKLSVKNLRETWQSGLTISLSSMLLLTCDMVASATFLHSLALLALAMQTRSVRFVGEIAGEVLIFAYSLLHWYAATEPREFCWPLQIINVFTY